MNRLLNILSVLTRPLAERDGTPSSMRWLLFVLFLFSVQVYLDWRWAFHLEMLNDTPDYEGITNLFTQMMVVFVGGTLIATIAKVIQKKFER